MSRNPRKDLIRRFVKFLIEWDDYFEGNRDASLEEWFLQTEANGILPDFSDDNFTIWFVGKIRQEFCHSKEIEQIARRFFELKILDPVKNPFHAALLQEILATDILGNREWYKLVGDYCIRNFRETDVGQMAIQFAKTFGVTDCDWEGIYGEPIFKSIHDILNEPNAD